MNTPLEQPAPRLRPMNLGDILDAVFRLYRRNFVTFLGIVALLQVPMIILQLLMTVVFGQSFITDLTDLTQELPRFDPSADSFNQLPLMGIALFYVGTILLALFQGLIIQQLIQGALTDAVAQSYLGRAVSIGNAYRTVVGRLPSLIGAGLLLGLLGGAAVFLVGLVFFGIVLGGSAAVGGGSGDGAAVFAVLIVMLVFFAVVLLVIALAFVLVRFSFFTQAIVVEGEGAVGGLRRSWHLVGGSYWRVLGIMLVVALLIYIIVGIPTSFASGIIAILLTDPIEHFVLRQVLTTLVTYLAQIIVLPVQLTAYTLLYFDLRVRHEGYDLELLAQQTNEGVLN